MEAGHFTFVAVAVALIAAVRRWTMMLPARKRLEEAQPNGRYAPVADVLLTCVTVLADELSETGKHSTYKLLLQLS